MHDDLIGEHFEMVRERYRRKAHKDGDWEEVPDAPMDQNELTRGMRR